jgi:hypothetical protein
MNPAFLYVVDGTIIVAFVLMCVYSFRPCDDIEQKNINLHNENDIDNYNILKYSSDYISFENEDIENKIVDNEIIQHNKIYNEIDSLV